MEKQSIEVLSKIFVIIHFTSLRTKIVSKLSSYRKEKLLCIIKCLNKKRNFGKDKNKHISIYACFNCIIVDVK